MSELLCLHPHAVADDAFHTRWSQLWLRVATDKVSAGVTTVFSRERNSGGSGFAQSHI